MTLTLRSLIGLTVGYLVLLFVIARAGDRWAQATRLSRHPLVAALALGVYGTSWSYFGSVGFAARDGWRYLAIYIGVTGSCALLPIVWAPLHRLVRERQLASLADLFAYRYQSRAAGAAVAGFLLLGSLPYQALQLRALVASVHEIGGTATFDLGLWISFAMIAFGIGFGARHATLRDRHDGFVLVIAVESLIKVVALLAITIWAVSAVFGGLGGLDRWLVAHPGELAAMAKPARDDSWVTLLGLSASAGFLLPRQWHLAFTESAGPRALSTTAWALPAYLLVLTLAVPPLLWAGRALGLPGDADFFVLGLVRASESPALASMVFVGALSAATAMMLVTTLALAAMAQNHLVVPTLAWARRGDLYRRVLWVRRGLIAAIVLGGYAVHVSLRRRTGLADLGLVSFVAVVQLVPGVLGVLFWPRATAPGALSGLAVGAGLWATTLVVPLFGVDLGLLDRLGSAGDVWATTTLSLGANLLVFIALSLVWPQRSSEADAAATCARRPVAPGVALSVTSPDEVVRRLAGVLGAASAERELARALGDLGLDRSERRPGELRRLRDRIEHNLSGLLGPLPARAAVDDALALEPGGELVLAQLRFVAEQRAAAEAPARELDDARRYLRRVLDDLPIGVVTLGPSGEVVVWNHAIANLTGVDPDAAFGARLDALPAPWAGVLGDFVTSGAVRTEVVLAGARPRTLALGRSALDTSALFGTMVGGVIVLIEDRTEQRALEAQVTHQDRLASIGRLAAGVAHEVGNPVVGIRLVAENLRREASHPELDGRLGAIVSATGRIDRIVRALVGYAHTDEGSAATRGPVTLATLVNEAFTLLRLSHAGHEIELVADVPGELRVRGDATRLEQVLVNLVGNACDASPPGSSVTVAARAAGAWIELTVADRGSGMPADVAARAFEPFFTTKPPGIGTGLGLPLVYSIVVDHGGTVEIDSAPGAGTTVRVVLPRLDGSPEATA